MMVGRLMLPMLIFYWPLHSIDHRLIGILSAILDKRLKTTKKFKWSNWARVHPHYWKKSKGVKSSRQEAIRNQIYIKKQYFWGFGIIIDLELNEKLCPCDSVLGK